MKAVHVVVLTYYSEVDPIITEFIYSFDYEGISPIEDIIENYIPITATGELSYTYELTTTPILEKYSRRPNFVSKATRKVAVKVKARVVRNPRADTERILYPI